MSKKLGNVSYQPQSANGESSDSFTKPFSEATAQTIDEEVRLLISQAYERTVQLVQQHRHHVLALAERLIQTETVNHDALVQVLGPRPFVTDAYAQWMLTGAQEAQNKAEQDRMEEQRKRKDASGQSTGGQETAHAALNKLQFEQPLPITLNPAAE